MFSLMRLLAENSLASRESPVAWFRNESGSHLSCFASDFLETLDEQAFFTSGTVNNVDALGDAEVDTSGTIAQPPSGNGDGTVPESSAVPGQQTQPQVNDLLQRYVDLVPPVLPSASLAEKFLLTAADPAPGTRDERLKRVIRTKYEAGLLKPYNYVKGYARLSRWMDCKYVDTHLRRYLVADIVVSSVCRRNQSSRSCSLYRC